MAASGEHALLLGEPHAVNFLDVGEVDDGVVERGGESEHVGLLLNDILSLCWQEPADDTDGADDDCSNLM